MSDLEDIKEQIKVDKEKQMVTLKKSNDVLSIKLECLELLKKHYEDFWLDTHLKYIASSLDAMVEREKFNVYDKIRERIDKRNCEIKNEYEIVDRKIGEAQRQLDLYQRLNPEMLEEYKRLKDDLECQDMMIQLSKTNDELTFEETRPF